MTEKELQKNVVGGNILSNILITLKIVLDLIPQLLLVYLISSLIEQNIAVEKVKYIFLAMLISFILKGVCCYLSTKIVV